MGQLGLCQGMRLALLMLTSPLAPTKLGEVGGGGDSASPLELLSSEWQESRGSGWDGASKSVVSYPAIISTNCRHLILNKSSGEFSSSPG